MAYWRRIGAVSLAVAMWALGGGVVSSHGNKPNEPKLSIVSYRLVRVERVHRNLREYTYRARLKNRGAAIAGARAVVARKHGEFQFVDGELTFGPVRSGHSSPSLDTFVFRHRGPQGLPGHGQFLRWEITPTAGNRVPTAHAGPDASMAVGQRARLDGSRSSDPDGDALTFQWAFASKPAASRAMLEGAETATPSFVVDAPGTYAVGLVVSDGQASSGQDTSLVTTPNTRPVANAGADTTAAIGERAPLSGAASSDADGDPLTYRWRLESRPAGSVASLGALTGVDSWLTPDVAGRYVAQLVVNDGRTDSLADSVVVSTLNSAPVARAGADQSATVGELVRLDGAASSDVDGDVLRFAWTVISRPAGSFATPASPTDVAPTVRIDRAGTYRLRLAVSDGLLSSAPDDVEISTRNTAPVANAGADAAAAVGETVAIDGSGSSDLDGDVLTYAWTLTSAPAGSLAAIDTPTAVAPHFTLDRAGTYVAQLIVNDGTVASAADTVVVTTRNSAPVARAGADRAAVAGQRVPLDGSASSDPDGSPLTFSWALVAVPPGSAAVLLNPLAPAPWFVADRDGLYVAQLIVSDGQLSSNPDTVSISTTNAAPTANAGADQIDVPVGGAVTLDGGASSDPDGQPLAYLWSLVARPQGSVAALSNGSSATPTLILDRPGDYVAQLVVRDGLLDSAPDTVLVRTANRAPVASAGADQAVAVAASVVLDGTGSSDPDGDTLSFSWQFVSRPAGSSAALNVPGVGQAAFVADVAGAFVVRLTVTDGAGGSASDEVQVDATATGRLDGPAAAAWSPAQVASAVEQDLVFTNSGGATVIVGGASATGDFSVDPLSSCLTDPVPAGDSCEITVTFQPTAAGPRAGSLTVSHNAPSGPVVVTLSGDGQAASLTVSPASLTFAATFVGQTSAPASSLVTNDGIGDVEIQSVSAGGDFALSNAAADRCQAAQVLAPGESCSATARFTPTSAGSRSGAATVNARGAGSATGFTQSVELGGDGVPPPVVSLDVTDGSASEWSADAGTVTLSRTGSTSASLTVTYTLGGAAASGVDYVALSGSATFAAGQAQLVLSVTPLSDSLNEGTESATVTLADGADYDLGSNVSGSVTIEDAYQEVSVLATDALASERGLNPGALTFTRVGSTSVALTVNFTVAGTATPGSDYASLGSSVVIPIGQASAMVPVTPVADALTEGSETVMVTLAAGTYLVGAPNSAVVTLEDDPQPLITVTAVDAAAAESGPDGGTFRFQRTGDTTLALTVQFSVSGGASNDGTTDFTPFLNGDVTFAAGSDTTDVVVTPVADSVVEGNETVVVTLVDGSRYNLGASVVATITIADAALPLVSVTALDADAAEAGLDPGVFQFARTGDPSAPLTVNYSRGGSALNSTDYVNIGGSITFAAGQATVNRTVMPINDALVEGAESVTVTITDGANYDLGGAVTASVSIADQPVPTISVEVIDSQASEAGDTGLFRFTRTGDVTLSLSFTITRGGTAANTSDYQNISLSQTFPAGESTLDRIVVPMNDVVVEGTQTVILTVVDGTHYDLGSPTAGTVSIADQPTPVITVTAVDPSASETGPDTGTFRFTRVGDTSLAMSVSFSRTGSASTSDFASIGTSITFPAGFATVDRLLWPTTDALVEPGETVVVTLTDTANYDVGSPGSATVTITD
jgi:hypothetical protein